jgi:hypothetical protein
VACRPIVGYTGSGVNEALLEVYKNMSVSRLGDCSAPFQLLTKDVLLAVILFLEGSDCVA